MWEGRSEGRRDRGRVAGQQGAASAVRPTLSRTKPAAPAPKPAAPAPEVEKRTGLDTHEDDFDMSLVADEEPDVLLLIVRFSVCVESQPPALVYTLVYAPELV